MRIASDHSNEGRRNYGCEPHESPSFFSEQRHIFIAPGTDRQDQPTSIGELLRERSGYQWRRSGADNRLVGGVRRRAHRAVTDEHEHVRDPHPA